MIDVRQFEHDLQNASLIKNEFDDNFFACVNGGSFNQTGATTLYNDFYKNTLSVAKTLYVIIGTDSGLLPKYIIEHALAKDSHYLFVELQSVFNRLHACDRPLPQHVQVGYHTLESWRIACEKPPLVYYLFHKQCEVIQSMAVIDSFCAVYQHLRQNIERQAQQMLWAIHGQIIGELFIEQQLLNVAENQIPATHLKASCAGKTAVVLAGGPSLDASLDWVKAHRHQLVVVSVSRIAKRLQQVGLVPDIVVAIDPTDKMFTVSKEMLNFPEKVLFVNADHVTSQLLGAWPHRRVYLGKRFPWDDKHDQDNVAAQGPTVTNAALALCIYMGFERVLLTGADLCYSQDGYTHAQGSREHQQGPQMAFLGQQVTCYNGDIADTDSAFYQATLALENQAKLAKKANCKLINLSSTAACIPGIEYCSTDDIELPVACVELQVIFAEHLPAMTPDWFSQDYASTLTELKKSKQQLQRCLLLVNECRELNKKYHGVSPHFDKQEAKLNKQFAPWLAMLKRFQMQNFREFFGQVHQSLDVALQVQQATEGYLSAYAISCRTVTAFIDAAIARVLSRQAEWSAVPLVPGLLATWAEEQQLGRSHLWQQAHPRELAACSVADRQALMAAVQAFQQSLLTNSVPAQSSELNLEQFKRTQSKCLEHYRSQDYDGLQNIMKRLVRQSSDGAKALQSLCAGYLSEFLQEYEQAKHCYYAAAEHPLCRELALNHLTSLLIKCHDNDNALLALECLCQISQGYCLSYVKLLASNDQTESAVAVLARYLAESPDDSQALMALNQLRKTVN